MGRKNGGQTSSSPAPDSGSAALVPYDEYLRFQELQEREVLRLFDRSVERLRRRNRQVSDDEVSRDVARAVREVRQAGEPLE